MKKFASLLTAVCFAAALCSCEESTEQGGTTVAATETTPLTLTESLTEESVPEPEPEIEGIMLAMFDPFSDSVKVDDTIFNELDEAVIEDADAAIIASGYYVFASLSDFCESGEALEENETEEYRYYPVNEKYAADEEELYNYLRKLLTEDFVSDEELRERLFEEDERGNAPNFKTIDGRLCVKDQYMGVPWYSHADLLAIKSYDGNTAEVVSMGNGLGYPPVLHVFMTLKKSEEGVWQLDKMELAEYSEKEVQRLYNALTLRQDALNAILGGGTVPESPKSIEIDGERYTETNTGMTFEEMREFFGEMFRDKIYVPDDYFANTKNAEPLLMNYMDKYIDSVYAEQDGVLYRKADAPVWYLPELDTDPYTLIGSAKLDSSGYFIAEQTFNDQYTGESFAEKVTVVYRADDYMSDSCTELYIASELPIREMTH